MTVPWYVPRECTCSRARTTGDGLYECSVEHCLTTKKNRNIQIVNNSGINCGKFTQQNIIQDINEMSESRDDFQNI